LEKNKNMKKLNASIFSCVLALIASGCITNKPLPPGLRTDAKSSGGLKIVNVGLTCDDAGLLVYGTVERTIGYSGTSFHHLDLEVDGPAGEVLSRQAMNFFPNPVLYSRFSPGRSAYTARLHELPPSGSKIIVTVHDVTLSQCPLTHPDSGK
jgi:hypothetical protein